MTRVQWLTATALFCALAVPLACSSDDDGKKVQPTPKGNPYAEYSIKVRVGPAGKEKIALLPPAPEAQPARLTAKVEKPESSAPGTSPQVNVDIGDSGVVDLQNFFGFPSEWLLLVRATAHCGGNDVSVDVTAPWEENSWFIFGDKYSNATGTTQFSSCDEILRAEEVLLCAANELTKIGNGIRAVEWPELPGATEPLEQRWLIPPQAAKDRFIARDVALSTLAHVARLDLELPAGHLFDRGDSCADAYAKSTDSGYFGTSCPCTTRRRPTLSLSFSSPSGRSLRPTVASWQTVVSG